ncbi:hypothetical protein [Pseudoclavibacter helvolus]|uniref:YobI family P-loop NTPase n=1 Tax=Pseudoclavibacter helvolus TaxID=255205 RepID=UPI003C7650E5
MSNELGAASPQSGPNRLGELDLSSLAPQFDEERHGGYYNLLARALRDNRHRNIALTGAYGAGKSSILQQLVKKKRRQAIVLSLSTIAPDAHDGDDLTGHDAEGSPRTREIQKEIVKQLLYRLKPSAVPQSRFRRPDLPRRVSAVVIAGLSALAIGALTWILASDLIQERANEWFPEVWRQWLAYGVALVLLCFMMWIIVKLVRARPKFTASVQSVGATVTLAKGEDSYFDAYLDEIVYFFQASRVRIVIIEDIDRFEDVLVFDTLRALNSILNGSRQVGGRVVFIYAIRDSVFEQIGNGSSETGGSTSTDETGATDHALDGLKRASRTKFFDIIIPVVPFVSADNARDLMSDVMKSDQFAVNPALIRLAARHVADMRLIRNIRNEFEVYRERLITSPNSVPGITDDLVFALVLYKNTHLADFEDIRHRESRLDYLFMFWRRLVSEELASRTKALAERRRLQLRESTETAKAQRLGTHLADYLATLRNASSTEVELVSPATEDTLMEPSTWEAIAGGEAQVIAFAPGSRYEVTLSLSAPQLGSFIGVPADGDGWTLADRDALQQTFDAGMGGVEFLRHHSWEELAKRTEFTADLNALSKPLPRGVVAKAPLTFDDAIELLLESDLARDLVRHGYITSDFAVYSASYYGTHLGPAAREYIWRCIEPGSPDASFEISHDQVEQLLREQGADEQGHGDAADIFDDASIFNVSILDYLLNRRPVAAAKVARRISSMGSTELEFLEFYLVHGASPDRLIAYLVPHWRSALTHIADMTTGDAAAQLTLLNAALLALPDSNYDTDEQLKTLIESHYRELPAVSAPESKEAADNVAGVLRSAGGQIPTLADLNDAACTAIVAQSLYPITIENLGIIVSDTVIALDTIEPNDTAYKYVLRHIDQYLPLVDDARIKVMSEPGCFAQTVDALVDHSAMNLLTRVIALTPDNCKVPDLHAVNLAAWPALVELRRTTATFGNVDAYLTEHSMDVTLGSFLRKAQTIVTPMTVTLDRRKAVALELVGARSVIDSAYIRVRLAKSVMPGKLPPGELTPEPGKLIAYLLQAKLLSDDATAFERRLMVDWDTLQSAILASKQFDSFVDSALVTIADFARIVRDRKISNKIVVAMLADLGGFLRGASRVQARALAIALADFGWKLRTRNIELLLQAGVGANAVMRLLHNAKDRCTTADIQDLLRQLGDNYAKVAEGGVGRPSFRKDAAHEYVFGRLVGHTVRSVKSTELKRWGGAALIVRLE